MRRFILAFAMCWFAIGNAAASGSLIVRAELGPSSTLPALPVVVWLEFRNPGNGSVELPTFLVVRATRNSTDIFLATGPDGTFFRLDPMSLQGRQTVRIGWTVPPEVDGNILLRDSRFRSPGTYLLEFLLFDHQPDLDSPGGLNPNLDPTHLVSSTRAKLTVENPEGDDARVLALVQEFEVKTRMRYGASLENFVVAREAVRLYPSSRYAPFLMLRASANDGSDVCALFERVIKQMPDRLLRAQVQASYAGTLARWAADGAGADVNETLSYGRRAAELLAQIESSFRSGDHPTGDLLYRVEEVRATLLSPEQYRQRFQNAQE